MVAEQARWTTGTTSTRRCFDAKSPGKKTEHDMRPGERARIFQDFDGGASKDARRGPRIIAGARRKRAAAAQGTSGGQRGEFPTKHCNEGRPYMYILCARPAGDFGCSPRKFSSKKIRRCHEVVMFLYEIPRATCNDATKASPSAPGSAISNVSSRYVTIANVSAK